MAIPGKTPAKTLTEKIWGSNWIDSIPVGWRESLKIVRRKTPGVSNNTDPDELTDDVVASQVTTNRTNELERETTEVEAVLSDKIVHEQDYDEQLDIVIPKTRYLTEDNEEVGLVRRLIRAFNPKVSEVTKLDLTAFETFAASYKLVFDSTTNIQLPNVLESISSFVETQNQVGEDEEEVDFASITNAGSLSVPARNSANSAIVAMPDVDPVITPRWGVGVKITHYIFLLPSPATEADVLAKLTTLVGSSVSTWPSNFRPKTATIFCVGGRASVMAKAVAQYQVGFNLCSDCNSTEELTSSGVGDSKELAITIKAVRLPETIHGSISVTGFASDTYSVDATATANAYAALGGPHTATAEISAYVTPLSLAATSGTSAIPSSNKYKLNTDAGPYKYGWIRYHVEVLDAANL